MLAFATSLIGKPFSNYAMARSVIWPRTSDNDSFFCAELVAAVLKKGGLMSSSSNPGAATPASLHALYKAKAACTGNPWKLQRFSSLHRPLPQDEQGLLGFSKLLDEPENVSKRRSQSRRRGDSPPRASFKLVS